MNEVIGIWTLVKTGSVENEKRTVLQTLVFIGKMIVILLFFKAVSIGTVLLIDLPGITTKPENLSAVSHDTFTPVEMLLLSAVFAPIAEELTFRLLLKFSKWNFIIGSVGAVLTFCRIILAVEYVYASACAIGCGIVLYVILNPERVEWLATVWANNKRIIFYALLMSFAFLHLKNYDITAKILLFSPIIILPRVLGGVVYSYIRMNSGILLGIFIHAFNNGFIQVINMIVH